MKRIRTLPEAPSGLAAYLDLQDDSQNWDEFRSFRSGDAYKELRSTLVSLQHGLCGYCEIRLVRWHIQVEHVIPQSSCQRWRRGGPRQRQYDGLLPRRD